MFFLNLLQVVIFNLLQVVIISYLTILKILLYHANKRMNGN